MKLLRNRPVPWVMIAVAVSLALLFTMVILAAMGASPIEAYANMLRGAFGSVNKWAEVLVAWVPLVLCATGLSFTFAAGLWNIGIEGQMIMGAIAATWAAVSTLATVTVVPITYFPSARAIFSGLTMAPGAAAFSSDIVILLMSQR